MGLLEEFYAVLASKDKDVRFDLPHSRDYYVMSLLNERFKKQYTIKQVQQLLFQEGLAEAKDYGIPLWYRRKYLGELNPP